LITGVLTEMVGKCPHLFMGCCDLSAVDDDELKPDYCGYTTVTGT